MLINIPSLDNYIQNNRDKIKEDILERTADKLAKRMMTQRPFKKFIFENYNEEDINKLEDELKENIINILNR